jgi:hypothetical protein
LIQLDSRKSEKIVTILDFTLDFSSLFCLVCREFIHNDSLITALPPVAGKPPIAVIFTPPNIHHSSPKYRLEFRLQAAENLTSKSGAALAAQLVMEGREQGDAGNGEKTSHAADSYFEYLILKPVHIHVPLAALLQPGSN